MGARLVSVWIRAPRRTIPLTEKRANEERNKDVSKRPPRPNKRPVTWDTVRQLALALPEVEEGTSYGTPAFRVRGKLFTRLHDSGESIVLRIDPDERTMRMKVDPESYYITDHYLNYPYMLVRLSAAFHN